MPRNPRFLVFVGIKSGVVALDERTGEEVWSTELRSGFIYVVWDGQSVLATTAGEVWRLDPKNGAVIWHNQLKGLGRGLASLASMRFAGAQPGFELVAEVGRQAAEAAATAAVVTG